MDRKSWKGIGAMNESQPYKIASGSVNASNQVLIPNSKDDYCLTKTRTIFNPQLRKILKEHL